ncbi:RrF2 family transcriptional regulator [Pseudodesulfovibrio tunisiensis]|uniref:RrF2 family transcriptional regulator n=1 Tax=Pseudodesulfovibrio tunisiensis TaxID=463192 RepID=UPI001FB2B85D|nr:RrF2 family transcriptional regulator [Pseudodesulfovibrio tunisiensis]
MKFSARTRYATRILLDLAVHADNTPRRAGDISEATGITIQFIEQIIRPLKKDGLVKSVRGASGGHMLAHSPDRISIGDIVRAMEGGINLADCLCDEGACNRSPGCKTRQVWERASRALETELDTIFLSELIESPFPELMD